MRKDLEENKEAQAYMQALRGSGIKDYASAEGEMRLVDIDVDEKEGASGEDDILPFVYNPDVLKGYFSRRPKVITFAVL